jgi:hypothetical protein
MLQCKPMETGDQRQSAFRTKGDKEARTHVRLNWNLETLPMKTLLPTLAFCSAAVIGAQAQLSQATQAPADATDYAIVERGPNHQVLCPQTPASSIASTSSLQDAGSGQVRQVGKVIELASGLNFWTGSAWSPSDPVFSIKGDRFIAERVQCRASVNADLNVEGAVTLTTPGGIVLRSTPVALVIANRASGEAQLVASVTNSIGELVSSNEIVFPNALVGPGVCVDITYVVDRGSFEQNLVFYGRLDPRDFGFAESDFPDLDIRLLTEFYGAPPPNQERRLARSETDPLKRQQMVYPDVVDETLSWDEVTIGGGEAYTTPSEREISGTRATVTKEFQTVPDEQRTFLVETLDYLAIKAGMDSLPDCNPAGGAQGATIKGTMSRGYAGIPRPAPAGIAQAKTMPLPRSLAQLGTVSKRPSVTLDYRATLTAGTTLLASDCT